MAIGVTPQQNACAMMAVDFSDKSRQARGQDWNVEIQVFYSSSFDSCIYIEIAIIGVDISIRDLTHTILRDGGQQNLLLTCNAEGANSVKLDAVSSFRGLINTVPYSEWLDDGFGGLPATLKTPDELYTRSDCQRVLDKWLSILKD